jgi:phosphoribosyl 1,2-cyclic phosphate phosphodiesterase
MKILILGTAAAEGTPAPFCECATCTHARQAGGHDLRMRAAVLVEDDLLLDCGPDLVAATQRLGVSLRHLETLLITHAHEDHLEPDNLTLRLPTFCPTPLPSLRVFGPADAVGAIRRQPYWPRLEAEGRVSVEIVRPGQRWQSGRYHITAIPATHIPDQVCLLYVVDDGARRLLYAADSGPLSENARRIVAQEAPFDAVLMEETMGSSPFWEGHHNTRSFLESRQRFVREGWLKEKTHFVAFHFSHQSNPPHEGLVRFFAPHGVRVAYDGMELVV